MCIRDSNSTNNEVRGITVPRTKLGTVVATVARILEPKSSAATVINNVQYPLQKPRQAQIAYNVFTEEMDETKYMSTNVKDISINSRITFFLFWRY